MFTIRPLLVSLAAISLGVLPISANDEGHDHGHVRDVSQLGKVKFPISCTTATQQEFNRDLTLFYSFWYPDKEGAHMCNGLLGGSYQSIAQSARRTHHPH